MPTDENLKERIANDPDFVALKRYEYSLDKLLNRYQDSSIPDRVIAQALNLSETELEAVYTALIAKLRERMGVKP